MEEKPLEIIDCQVLSYEAEDVGSSASTSLGRKIYKCDVCDYACNQLHKLKIHKLIHSVGEQPYKCNICGYAFNRLKSLKRHKVVHSEEKPF